MELIKQVINDLIDANISLEAPLLKTKVLATRINNQELLSWVNQELTGYPENIVPAYRIYTCSIIGAYNTLDKEYKGIQIPTEGLDTSIRDELKYFKFNQGVSSLESIIKEPGSGILERELTAELIKVIEANMKSYMNMSILDLYDCRLRTAPNVINQLLSIVKSRLLDFMLELENKFGIKAEIETLKTNNQIITNMVTNNITNNGDGNVTNTGNDSKLKAKINIKKLNKQSLREGLLSNKVSEEDINELLSIVDKEEITNPDNFGKPINSWISKMYNKALNGSWDVASGAAGGILTTIISQYYGL